MFSTTTSVLAFVPLAVTAIYSATKAALHSNLLSQRFLLPDSGVQVLEVAPPWVRTKLMNSQDAEQAMPLDRLIAEALDVLGTDADEILVEAAKPLRANPGPEGHALVNGFNQQRLKLHSPGLRNLTFNLHIQAERWTTKILFYLLIPTAKSC
jgi:uncharacterized oxidoreductase